MVFSDGGGEGSRTPVRRWVDRTFSGCRRLLEFPAVRHQSANAAPRYLFICMASSKEKGKRTFITQFDARFCAVILAEGTGGINGRGTAVRLPMLLVCQRLILIGTYFRVFPDSTRLSYLNIPVETFTPPYQSKVLPFS